MNLGPGPLDPIAHLAGLPLWESGMHPLDVSGVSVRAYPFPYIAALTISNDLDSMRPPAFEGWHAFVNGRGPTADGDGLGLEIGDSFWVWGHRLDLAIHWHHPEVAPPVDSPRYGRIIELGRSGWLDTLHSLGNWQKNPSGEFSLHAHRDQAAYALDRLDRLGVRPRVYVNHSASVSNVGGPWGRYERADDRRHPFYCIDLLKAFGLRFFWLGPCTNIEKFGDHLQYPSEHHLQRAIHRFNWPNWLRYFDEQGSVLSWASSDDAEADRRLLTSFFNRTLIHLKGRDGTPILAFKRHRGFEQPVMSTFCNQVTEPDLDALERMRGVAIIYQHFGLSGPRGRSPALSVPQRQYIASPVFDEHVRARLRDVSARFHAGRLWVALTSRVLNYLSLRESLRFSVAREEAKWIVHMDKIDCGATGRRPLTDEDLNGLSLSVPRNAPEVVVAIQGRTAILPVRRAPDPGWPDRDAIYLPWRPLEWPE